MPPTSSKQLRTPKEYIEAHGHPVGTVVKVWSAGESDLGGETYLFLDRHDKPFTAVEIGDDFVIRPGWDQFNPIYLV
jgi:hypothetical protein